MTDSDDWATALEGPPKKPMKRRTKILLWIFAAFVGWLTLSTAGAPIPFFGFELPALLAPDKALSRQIKDIHETIATIGYFVIGLHAAAALFHHYVLKDGTLRRMWRR